MTGKDRERAQTKAADAAAAKTLEQRNIINPEIEKQLRADIELSKKLAPAVQEVVSASEAQLQVAAHALRAWLHDWRTTAQVCVTRRDYRIMLGISHRRQPAAQQDNPQESPPAAPQTTPGK